MAPLTESRHRILTRKMEAADTAELVEIKRRVFGERRADSGLWAHLYYGQPWGPIPGAVSEIDGRLAGGLSAISRRVRLDGRVTVSAQHVDAMVLPEARGHSLYKRMIDEATRVGRGAGAQLIYSLPNRVSAPRLLSEELGWRGAFTVPAYGRIIRPRLLASAASEVPPALRFALPAGLQVAAASQSLAASQSRAMPGRVLLTAPPDVDQLWERCANAARFQTVRDREYLTWRYDDNPGASFQHVEVRHKGRLVGLVVVTEQEFQGASALIVMDWLVHPQEDGVFATLLRHVRTLAERSPEVALVLVFALPPFSRLALRQGFWRIPGRALPTRMFFCFQPDGHSPTEAAALARSENWHLTFGDSDLV